MISPIIMHRPDFCPHCKNHSIEIFDYFNNVVGYSKIIDAYLGGARDHSSLNNRKIYKMRCRKCGIDFQIRYEGNIPLPDYYQYHKENASFMSDFMAYARKKEDPGDQIDTNHRM